jgi:hypothetical protein
VKGAVVVKVEVRDPAPPQVLTEVPWMIWGLGKKMVGLEMRSRA